MGNSPHRFSADTILRHYNDVPDPVIWTASPKCFPWGSVSHHPMLEPPLRAHGGVVVDSEERDSFSPSPRCDSAEAKGGRVCAVKTPQRLRIHFADLSLALIGNASAERCRE